MKKIFCLLRLSTLLLLLVGCENVDTQLAVEAGLDAFTAATLTDEQVKLHARSAADLADGKHRLAPPTSAEAQRLARLLDGPLLADGLEYDVRVYLAKDVNAFAMADGTIRIYGGLMTMLDDRELLFVIGHEMGHVALRHVRKRLMLAHAASAVRKGVAAQQEGQAGEIARSVVGALTEQLLNAQFSQQEEREADDHGLAFVKSRGHDGEAAVTALRKLATLGASHHFLSSHPAPEKRALRLRDRLDGKGADEQVSGLAAVWTWCKEQLVAMLALLLAMLQQTT